MSATINLLPRKEFEITLEDGTVIKGQFGTWALKRFCDKINCELEDIGERFKKPKIGDIFEFLLAAVEYRARLKGDPFSYNDVRKPLSSQGFLIMRLTEQRKKKKHFKRKPLNMG